MFVATKRRLIRIKYELMQENAQIGSIRPALFGESAKVLIGKSAFGVKRKSPLGMFQLLDAQNQPACSAKKHLNRSFSVTIDGLPMRLSANGLVSRSFSLMQNGSVIGTIVQKGWFRKRTVADLPPSIPIPVQVFLVTLVLFMWKRSTDIDVSYSSDNSDSSNGSNFSDSSGE